MLYKCFFLCPSVLSALVFSHLKGFSFSRACFSFQLFTRTNFPLSFFLLFNFFLFLLVFEQSVKRSYCNRTNFRTRFNFVYFVLLAESTKFSSIWKPYTYTSVSDTTVAVRKFLAYESRQTLEYEIFTRTKISAITVEACRLCETVLVWAVSWWCISIPYTWELTQRPSRSIHQSVRNVWSRNGRKGRSNVSCDIIAQWPIASEAVHALPWNFLAKCCNVWDSEFKSEHVLND